jgi:hypothetical protein|tara:strand:+ start:508 stop:666 length:159 start_codon:yes stop_codon:yes gene_type:complete
MANASNAKTKAASAKSTAQTQQTADATQEDITATLNMTPAERMAKLNKEYGT